MAITVSYSCDQCGKPIPELHGPLVLSIRSDSEPLCNRELDLCSINCLLAWARHYARDPQRSREFCQNFPRPVASTVEKVK